MLSLGIETSCDETAASVVQDGRIVLSSVIASSLRLHKKYQGIIPEIAFRAHIESISLVTRRALEAAGKKIKDVGLICVTKGPGLIGSLLPGISFAKGLSYSLKKPLIGVDHLQAHLYASFLTKRASGQCRRKEPPSLPFIGLVVSGGHTSLFLVDKNFTFRPIGATVDDAAGEAFDKVAKILNLGYPGGPIIERVARKGSPEGMRLSCSGPEDLNFSFSGIKTAVLYKTGDKRQKTGYRDIAASFQKAVVEALLKKSFMACERNKINTLAVGGGVSANRYLRERFEYEAGSRQGFEVYFPPLDLSLDNGAMIAGLGYRLFKKGIASDYYLSPAS
ncbi:tRNA (adenosine(37)-N6)-threonylcarbamoyltransferase complex transferase subunit TsaD [bacterium]|nr:MAG: tRNA (adenosine(37)-N6)-threonylcarbamoyltransferase complex transferase subunit TsaD [bacterium]